jgi:hypothetical protein
MTLQRVRRCAIGFFVAYAIAVMYPGVVLLRGPRPFVLGMPLAMAWAAAWVVAAFFVLLLLDRAYSRAQRAYDAGWHGEDASGRSPGGHLPGGHSPGGRSPGGRSPGGRSPGGRSPGGHSPGDHSPGGHSPSGPGPSAAER